MRRLVAACIFVPVIALFGTSDLSHAQTAKVYRIGWLGNGSALSDANSANGDFQRGLRDLGYSVGQNMVIEYRYADGNIGRLQELAIDLARMPVDVIVTSGDAATLAAKRATTKVPIVATEFGLDPVKTGLVASLARPDGNLTGLGSITEGLWPKRLGVLKQLAPKVRRVAVLWNPNNPENVICVDEMNTGATAQGMQVRALEIRDARTLDQALSNMGKEQNDAIAICWDSVTLTHAKLIAEFALSRRWPTVAPLREYAEAGALLSIGARLPAQRRRTAYYVDKILKGATPSTLPVELPMLFEFVVNLRTAKALGLTLPPATVYIADELLE